MYKSRDPVEPPGEKLAAKVVIVDDHALVREGFKKLISDQWDMEVVAECATASELLEVLDKVRCDVLVLDINLPDRSGMDVLYDLKVRHARSKVLMLSMHPEERFGTRALKACASGYLSKGCAASELTRAIRRLASGGRYISEALADQLAVDMQQGGTHSPHELLSDREFQVLTLIGEGKSTQQMTSQLSVSQSTVNTYRMRILQKMNLKTTRELIRYAIHHSLVD